ncbi:MAG: hypothetical protein QOD09_2485 [Bradyrhizobium sp.]|jgi:hypothetical protein|nr:hypothetical protein [Bradyrhizobium sp.]MEA2950700.1 hypothetical protein [Alphaproteobacteria bacterium]
MKEAVLLDAGMSSREALYRLAQHGYWKHPDVPSARLWLDEYVIRINKLAAQADRTSPGDREAGEVDGAAAAVRSAPLNFEDAIRLNARAAAGQWAAIRRQDSMTIFWYARPVQELLDLLSEVGGDVNLRDALNLHEYEATPSIQAAELPRSSGKLAIVLHGNDLIGVREDIPNDGKLSTRGFRDVVRSASPFEADLGGAVLEESARGSDIDVSVRAFPLLQAPQKVATGEAFDLEIGLSETPVAGVTSPGEVVLRAAPGAATIPVEIQVIADGFEAPNGWKRTLDVIVAEPTRVRVKVALVALQQNEPLRLTKLLVHFAVAGVRCGSASRNIVVESSNVADGSSNSTVVPPDNTRGLSWLAGDGPPPGLVLGPDLPAKPDIELNIYKLDGNTTGGSYRCSIWNAHVVPVPDGSLAIELGNDAGTFAKLLINEVRQWSGDRLVDTILGNIGKIVRDKLPAEFWTVLQGVAAVVKDRPVTLQLNSAEPYVPWELARVDPPIDPARPPFLSAQVAMGRWIVGDRSVASPPPATQSVRAMAVMAGMYKIGGGLRALPEAVEEAKIIAKSYEKMPVVPLECTAANLNDLLEAELSYQFNSIGGVQCVHFAGHGEIDPTRPEEAAIYLNDGRPITPLFFNGSTLGKTCSPFIFLNACMVGTAGEMLGGFGGFPGNCLAGGFCGLLAPLWAVNDSVARSIAIDFYQQTFSASGDRSIADILRDIRSKYQKKTPVATYMAYVYYGNPNLKLTWTRPVEP